MRFRLAALAASLAFSGLGAAPARAAVTQPTGEQCNFNGFSQTGSGVWTIVFRAGPLLVADEDDPATSGPATVTCTIRTANSHTAPVHSGVTSIPSYGVAALPPTTVTVPGELPEDAHLCTQVDVGGRTLYWRWPGDRNADGWWTDDPATPCDEGARTLELRSSDPPMRYVLSGYAMALGEGDVAVEAFEGTACADPGVRDAVRDVWWCGYPASSGIVSFARVPGVGAVVRETPFGWTCTDVRSGLPVDRGSLLTTPDPGVSCVPAAPFHVQCEWVQVSGYLAPATLGRVGLTATCGQSVTRWLIPAQARLAEQWSGFYYGGPPPLRCTADEQTHPVDAAYVATCQFLGYPA